MPSDGEIAAAHREGAQRWPHVVVSLDRFVNMLRAGGVSTEDLGQWAGDLYLACAAGAGDHAAIREIEERFIARLPGRIRRLGATRERVDDVLQGVRERLLTGPVPRICAYNGAGPLEQWIKVIAIRTAINMNRSDQAIPRVERAWQEAVPPSAADASVLAMKAEYKREIEVAIRALVDRLSPRDRAILRLHIVEGVSVEKIAVTYGVHRVTVARWIWTAGETLLDALRHRFKDRFGITPSDFDSLARLARSQLSLDLDALLV